jgi:DNA-binding HxlR family transcriptional regulator
MRGPLVASTSQEALVREKLARIADKWTLVVIDALAEGDLRFPRPARTGGRGQKLSGTVRTVSKAGRR